MRIGVGPGDGPDPGRVRLSAGLRAAGGAARRLAGGRPWGRVDVDVLPYGVTRYRLVVYPPGITPGARLRVRAWRAWPLAGAVVAATVALATAGVLAPALAVAAGVSTCLAGFVVLGVTTLPERRLVRQVWAADPGDLAALDDVLGEARVRLLADLLCAADEALAAGELTPAEHLAVWSCVYREVGGLLRLDLRVTELVTPA